VCTFTDLIRSYFTLTCDQRTLLIPRAACLCARVERAVDHTYCQQLQARASRRDGASAARVMCTLESVLNQTIDQ